MAVTPADQEQAFVREVDENLRRDRLADFGRRYGKVVLAAIAAALVVLAGVLWWQHHRRTVAGEQGEQLQGAFEKIGAGDLKGAAPALTELSTSGIDGYRAAAVMSQAAVAVEAGDNKTAAARFAAVANDAGLPRPYRDLALVKQTMVEFDTLAPQAVIDRLGPVAVAGNAFRGSAGELVGLAQLRLGRRAAAGASFAALAKDDSVPGTIRQRAVQMAGVLGVDAVQPAPAANGAGR